MVSTPGSAGVDSSTRKVTFWSRTATVGAISAPSLWPSMPTLVGSTPGWARSQLKAACASVAKSAVVARV